MALIFVLGLFGFTRIHQEYDDCDKIRDEFGNVENDVQSQQFTVVDSTTALLKLKDNQIVVFSCGTVNQLMWRHSQELYTVKGSCVTIWR